MSKELEETVAELRVRLPEDKLTAATLPSDTRF
jgi:hypothetical protein